jgi:hypothetical protein
MPVLAARMIRAMLLVGARQWLMLIEHPLVIMPPRHALHGAHSHSLQRKYHGQQEREEQAGETPEHRGKFYSRRIS